jgi:hypothetical protein
MQPLGPLLSVCAATALAAASPSAASHAEAAPAAGSLQGWLARVGAGGAHGSLAVAGVADLEALRAHAAADPELRRLGLPMRSRKQLAKVRKTSWANFSLL